MTAPAVRSFEPVSELQILAAVDRAARHTRADSVPGFRLAEHLGLAHGTPTTRELRPLIEKLTEDGALVHSQRHRTSTLRLTSKGRERLARARREGRNLDLPEAPQHRRWRHAHDEATTRIDELRNDLRTTLTATNKLLQTGEPESKAALELLTRLRQESARLAWAIHCIHDWPEPDDAHVDIDLSQRRGELKLVSADLIGVLP
jgi:DNA-binding MarR family transcriptional regulator